MSPEQAAFCVLHPNHPAAQELMQRSWDDMMQKPENKAAFDAAVRRFSDAIDDKILADVYRDLYGKEQH